MPTKLKWAFNSATVMNLPWAEEFKLLQQYKLSAIEPWYDKLKKVVDGGSSFEAIGRQLKDAGIALAGVAPAVCGIPSKEQDAKAEADAFKARVDATAALGAPALTVVILGDPGNDIVAVHKALGEKLHKFADQAQQRSIRINLEFLGGLPIDGCLTSCIDLIKRTNHPALGMLFDLCHYYTSKSHMEDLALLPAGKMFHVHVDDARPLPIEKLTNADRIFPGQGGLMNVPLLLKEIVRLTKFTGYFAIELYDEATWKRDPNEVFREHVAAVTYCEERL